MGNLRKNCTLLLFLISSVAFAQSKRIALVIGAQNYTGLPVLRNSHNDATTMASALQSKGFQVEVLYDPKTKREIKDAINRYFNEMRDLTGAVGIIYYAGHGMQYEGENYIIPINATLQNPSDLEDFCVKMNSATAVLKSTSKSLNILLLDACRSLPSFTRDNHVGLSRMEAPQGSIIVFATQPGKVASDGTGTNGLFTAKMLKAMEEPNLNITDVFKKVKQEVFAESKETQLPSVEDNSIGDDFYFNGVAAKSPVPQKPVEIIHTKASPIKDYSNAFDSLFTNRGNIAVNIKEITEDAVKFTYPGEELIISIYKYAIYKVKLKSGRIEEFEETLAFKVIKGGDDWEKVLLTPEENRLKGLFKLGDVMTKAMGTTRQSSEKKVKDRAYKKMKIETAMLGGNIIYVAEEKSRASKTSESGTPRTELNGVAYNNQLPSFDEFKKIINLKSEFEYRCRLFIGNSSADLDIDFNVRQRTVKVSEVRNATEFILLKTNLKGEEIFEFRVIYFDQERIVLMRSEKNKIYNIILNR